MAKKEPPPGKNQPYLLEEMKPEPPRPAPYTPPWERGPQFNERRSSGKPGLFKDLREAIRKYDESRKKK